MAGAYRMDGQAVLGGVVRLWPRTRRPAMLLGMSTAAARVLEEALQLPEDQRADLVAELLASLTPATQADARTEAQWLAEVERRARAAIAGDPGIPWDQAQQEIERRLRDPRQ